MVTLNNDTVVVTPDWLEQMLALASLPDVGIVGACLLDQDGRREHEGIVIAPYPQHLRTDSNYPHVDYFSSSLPRTWRPSPARCRWSTGLCGSGSAGWTST